MPVCSRCGTNSLLKDEYCSVCGLYQNGGKGNISFLGDYKIDDYKISEREDPGIIDFTNHTVSRYYDIKKLKTQTIEEIYNECDRVYESIVDIENTLEKHDPYSNYFLDLFKEYRTRRDQLDALTEYFKYRLEEPSKDRKLESIYGRLPNWRIEQKREAKMKKK